MTPPGAGPGPQGVVRCRLVAEDVADAMNDRRPPRPAPSSPGIILSRTRPEPRPPPPPIGKYPIATPERGELKTNRTYGVSVSGFDV
jgi:hypothetical protein